jgi:hypothetical protein
MSSENETTPIERAAGALYLHRSTPDGLAHDVLEAALGDREQVARILLPDAFPVPAPGVAENIGRVWARKSAYQAADRLIAWALGTTATTGAAS